MVLGFQLYHCEEVIDIGNPGLRVCLNFMVFQLYHCEEVIDIGKPGIVLFSPRFPMAPSSRRVIDLEILWFVVKIKKQR